MIKLNHRRSSGNSKTIASSGASTIEAFRINSGSLMGECNLANRSLLKARATELIYPNDVNERPIVHETNSLRTLPYVCVVTVFSCAETTDSLT